MQVALGRKGDYSVRAMIDLARHYNRGRRKAREIALTMDIPERYLTQLLTPFVRRGLLSATAGPDGGYALLVAPAAISLLEVVEAAEGPLESPRCVLEGGPCDWAEMCPVHDAWSRGRAALANEFQATSFAELAAEDAAIGAGSARRREASLHARAVTRRGVRDAS